MFLAYLSTWSTEVAINNLHLLQSSALSRSHKHSQFSKHLLRPALRPPLYSITYDYKRDPTYYKEISAFDTDKIYTEKIIGEGEV